jgi:putative aminopeptidase FrvX
MITSKELELLSRLCAAPGIPGHEGQVAAAIRDYLSSKGIDNRLDRIGNVIAHIPGAGQKLALLVHMDEVGLLVRKINPTGFLHFERVGGTSTHTLPGQRVEVWTGQGPVKGTVGAFHQHLAGDSTQFELSSLFIDIGCRSKAQAQDLGIEVGSPITFAPAFELLNGRISSKALDDRAGCFLLLQLADLLLANPSHLDIFLVFIVQEESILQGAVPAIYDIQPDWAIGLDATLAFDTPDQANGPSDLFLGQGTVIKVMDHLRGQGVGFIAHLALRHFLEDLARKNGIVYQKEVVIGLSTAASPLPYIRTGLPVAAVSFPLRYAHSPAEMVELADLQATLDFLNLIARTSWPKINE